MELLKTNKKILFLIGSSGVGKSSLLIELDRRGIVELTPSWTTRPPRPEENQGTIEHNFISDKEFDRLKNQAFFLEVLQLFNLPYRFGLPHVKQPNEKRIPAVVLRTYLLPLMEKHYSNGIVYALEDTFERVEQRLHERLANGEAFGSRLEEYESEINLGRKLALRTFKNNSSIENLADEIQQKLKKDF